MSIDTHSIADQQDGEEDDGDNPLRSPALRGRPRNVEPPKAARRKGDKSGKHAKDTPRRKLSAREETWLLWDLAAKHAQTNWAAWARGILTAAAAGELGIDVQQALDEAEL